MALKTLDRCGGLRPKLAIELQGLAIGVLNSEAVQLPLECLDVAVPALGPVAGSRLAIEAERALLGGRSASAAYRELAALCTGAAGVELFIESHHAPS